MGNVSLSFLQGHWELYIVCYRPSVCKRGKVPIMIWSRVRRTSPICSAQLQCKITSAENSKVHLLQHYQWVAAFVTREKSLDIATIASPFRLLPRIKPLAKIAAKAQSSFATALPMTLFRTQKAALPFKLSMLSFQIDFKVQCSFARRGRQSVFVSGILPLLLDNVPFQCQFFQKLEFLLWRGFFQILCLSTF